MTKHILMAAGGTGGHIFPALALAHEFKARGYKVSWLGCERKMEGEIVVKAGYEFHSVNISGIAGKYILAKFKALWQSFKAGISIIKLIKKQKIDYVFCMGGYVSGAAGIAALLTNRKLFVHEQNSVVGITNSILAEFATQVFVAFPSAFSQEGSKENNKKNIKKKIQIVGQPLRQSFYNLDREQQLARLNRLKDPNYTPKLLVMGGSLGAQIINKKVPQALATLPDIKINIIHQAGANKDHATSINYQEANLNPNIEWKVIPFIDDVYKAYYDADFIICRSGAITVFEVLESIIPPIFIPFEHADRQQAKNAQFLTSIKCGTMIQESELTITKLAQVINQHKSQYIFEISENMFAHQEPNAVIQIADYIDQIS